MNVVSCNLKGSYLLQDVIDTSEDPFVLYFVKNFAYKSQGGSWSTKFILLHYSGAFDLKTLCLIYQKSILRLAISGITLIYI